MNIFLTGDIQVGKSTAISRFLHAHAWLRLGGFQTVSLPRTDGKAGFALHILPPPWRASDANEANLVGLRGEDRRAFPEVFESAGVELLLRDGPFDLLLMDELGRMELDSPGFCASVLFALDGNVPVLGVVKPEHNVLLDAVRAHPKTVLLNVDAANRDSIPAEIERLLFR